MDMTQALSLLPVYTWIYVARKEALIVQLNLAGSRCRVSNIVDFAERLTKLVGA